MSVELLKVALNNREVINAAEIMYELFTGSQDHFIRSILLADCLPEPLQLDFEEKNDVLETFYLACAIVEEKLPPEKVRSFVSQVSVQKAIIDLFILNKSNINELSKKELFEFPIPRILYMTCVFIENQHRLSSETHENGSDESYISLFSTSISAMEGPNGKISTDSNNETSIEMAKLILLYLFYKGKKELDTDIDTFDDVSPYEIASLEKLHVLGVHRGTLEYLWECIKFRSWNFSIYPDAEEDPIFFYAPPSREAFKIERAATERYKYKAQVDLYNKQEVAKGIKDKLLPLLEELSKEIVLNDKDWLLKLNNVKLKELIILVRGLNNISISSLEFLDSNFWEKESLGKEKNITFENVFIFVSYLQSLSMVYSERSHENFDDRDRIAYRYLVPRLRKENLISHFSELFKLDINIVSEIANLFIFQPRGRKDFSDLFLQPLVYFGRNEILFVPTLIKQINIPRLIEELFGYYRIDDAYKGHKLENDIRRALSGSKYLRVHSGELIINEAYDGRSAEFDFFGMMGDRVLLIEMKCLRRPYSPKEVFEREREVLYGVEQVNRRARVVQHDWDRIREKTKIKNLPKRPPNPQNIIKIVCLNIFDFTGLIVDGAYITDVSSLTKYLLNPVVQANHFYLDSGDVETVMEYSLWRRNYPYPDEFTDFLKKPLAMRDYFDSLDEMPRRVMRIEEEDPNLGFFDYSLIRDPTKQMLRHFAKKKKKKRTRSR